MYVRTNKCCFYFFKRIDLKFFSNNSGVIGEKLQINSFEKVEAAFVGSYIHAGNKIATIVGLSSASEGADVVAKDVAMHALQRLLQQRQLLQKQMISPQ